ncbi:hypothetical protein [Agromyces sp. PvR057]|uniref:hypothetical protein n=1 Tax=Agromyces sp. PvR057 TaxID=3156403 RepID=UPI003399774C
MRRVERTAAAEAGRRHKAEQFARATEIVDELADDEFDLIDAVVTLCVHAGIAASDVICMRRLGTYAQGESHTDAIKHLYGADTAAANQLSTLLGMKTKAGYGQDSVSATDVKRAVRAMHALLVAMRQA